MMKLHDYGGESVEHHNGLKVVLDFGRHFTIPCFLELTKATTKKIPNKGKR